MSRPCKKFQDRFFVVYFLFGGNKFWFGLVVTEFANPRLPSALPLVQSKSRIGRHRKEISILMLNASSSNVARLYRSRLVPTFATCPLCPFGLENIKIKL